MICATCGGRVSADPCSRCGRDPLLVGRYQLDEVLGEGAEGTTYRATRLADGAAVAIKELPLRRAVDVASLELLRREARTLRLLDHPGIPRYLDDFVAGEGKTRALFIVQEYINGRTLEAEADGHHYEEEEILRILEELLVILGYMHGLDPPVCHRDLKPGNLMRRGADGKLLLVDFGMARDILRDSDAGATTVAGTFGFMSPEQLRGVCTPASDLYGLGALAVALLCRRQPHRLLDNTYRMKWREQVQVSPGFADLLGELLQPDPEARPPSADQALARVRALRGVSAAGEIPRFDPHDETRVMSTVEEDGDPTVPPWAVGPAAVDREGLTVPEGEAASWWGLGVVVIGIAVAVGLMFALA